MDKRFAAIAGALTTLVHIATTGQYGYYRDELYFIACAKRLAWGYVDMPPLTSFIAWLSTPAHYNLFVLRAGVAIAAGLTVYFAAALTAELGGSVIIQRVAAVTVALTPVYLFLGNTLTTTSFEPLTWTLVIYATLRLIRTDDQRWWIAIAAAVAFGHYGKYSMALLVTALIFGLLCTPERRILRQPGFALAACAVVLLLLPNIFWQVAHGWPFLDVMRGDIAFRHAFNNGWQFEFLGRWINFAAFSVEQLLFIGPIVLPVCIAGVVFLLRDPQLQFARFLAFGYIFAFIAAVALMGKGYYIAGFYVPLIAAGWIVEPKVIRLAKLRSWSREESASTRAGPTVALAALAWLQSLVMLPFTVPVLPPSTILWLNQEKLANPLFADEFGWDGLARRVAFFYDKLPPAQRRRTAIFSDTYGGAGALELYGPRYGLPQPISAQNNYYLWGTRGYDGSSMLAIGASQANLLRANFRSVVLLGTYANIYRVAEEGPTPIFLCTDPIAPLPVLWPRFRWYGA